MAGTVPSKATFAPIIPLSTNLDDIQSTESALTLPSFTSDDAFSLGIALRERLRPAPKPAVISILLANSRQLLFHSTTQSGTTPDNDIWVARKVKTVLRFGLSTFFMNSKFKGDEKAFAEKYGLGPEESGTYAIHGGAVPVRVTGVEGMVAVVVVSGLKQEEDHAVIIEVFQDWMKTK